MPIFKHLNKIRIPKVLKVWIRIWYTVDNHIKFCFCKKNYLKKGIYFMRMMPDENKLEVQNLVKNCLQSFYR
jgi:hypothetical protein